MELRIFGYFLAHATCSVSMVLLNKTLALGFDYPWTVVFAQNVGTVLLGFLWPLACGDERSSSADGGADGSERRTFLGLVVPRASKNRLWTCGQTALFCLTLFMSLKALRFVSVPLYVVARNMVPACTAFVEWAFAGTEVCTTAIVGLACTVLGAVIYTAGDLSMANFDWFGTSYALLLVSVVAVCSVVDKTAIRALVAEENMTPVECNQNRVVLSMPLNVLLILSLELYRENAVAGAGGRSLMEGSIAPDGNIAGASAGDISMAAGVLMEPRLLQAAGERGAAQGVLPPLITAFASLTPVLAAALFLSTIFGFGMGTFNFVLQQAVNAATVQVANILYKLVTTMLSRVTHPAPVAAGSWLGFAISLTGVFLYTFGQRIEEYWFPELVPVPAMEPDPSRTSPTAETLGVEMDKLVRDRTKVW